MNIIQSKLTKENKQIIFFSNINDRPDIGRFDTIYYITNTDIDDVSYQWDGSNYVVLTTGDLCKFYNVLNNFPPQGDENLLYVHTKYNFIYGWNNEINQYHFIKVANTVLNQILFETEIIYTSKSVPPVDIQLNTIYKIGFDDEYYVYNSLQKINITINDILERFSPWNGQRWADVLGKYAPDLPVPDPYKDYKEELIQLTFDVNTDGKIDTARNSERLGGKTGDFFLNFNNFINVPDYVTRSEFYNQNKNIEDINQNIEDTRQQVDIITNGAEDTPQKPNAPILNAVYTSARIPRIRIEWEAVTKNTDGTNISDLDGYKILKSKNNDLSDSIVFSQTDKDTLIKYDNLVEENETWYYAIQAYDKFKNMSAISDISQVFIRDSLSPDIPLSVSGYAVYKTVFADIVYPVNNIASQVELYYVEKGTIRDTNKVAGSIDFPLTANDLVYKSGIITTPSFDAHFDGYIYVRTISVNDVPSEYAVSELIQLEKISGVDIEDATIGLQKFANDLQLTDTYIQDGAITLEKLMANIGLTADYLADGTINLSKLASDLGLTSDYISNGAITLSKLAQNLNLTGDYLANGIIDLNKLAKNLNLTGDYLAEKSIGAQLLDQSLRDVLYINGDINGGVTTISANEDEINLLARRIDGIQYNEFFDTFDGYLTRSGNGSASIINIDGDSNKQALQVNGCLHLVKDVLIPFNPSLMYIMKIKIKQAVDSTIANSSLVYAGFEGVSADGVTLININGQNEYGDQHYFTCKDELITVADGWKEYTGFLKGYGTNLSNVGTMSNPANMHENVRYVRPVFIVNYNGGDGTCLIDYQVIKVDSGDSWANIKTSADAITLIAGETSDNSTWIGRFSVEPEEIDSTVLEVYPNGKGNISSIEQQAQQIKSTVARINGINFSDYFDTAPTKYIQRQAPTNLNIIDDIESVNGKVLKITGQGHLSWNENIPFDPNVVYKMTIKIKQSIDSSTIGSSRVFAGFECVAEDGVTLINTNGQNDYTSGHYFVIREENLTMSNGWKEYTGYLRGYGDRLSVVGTITNPANVYYGVKFIRPSFLVNYQNGNGTCLIDYITVSVDANNVLSIIQQNADSVNILTQFKNDNETLLSGISVEPEQINAVVGAVFENGDINASKIEATNRNISLEVSRINDSLARRGIIIPENSLYFNFNSRLTPTNGKELIGTTIASIRPDQGVFGGALAIEKPTTNLHTDQSIFTPSTGTVYTRVLETSGEFAGWYKVTVSKIEEVYGILANINNAVDTQINEYLSASIDFYSLSGNIYPYLGGSYGVGELYPLNNSKYRMGRTWKNLDGSGSMRIYFKHKSNTAQSNISETFYYKDSQVEKMPYCTSFTKTTRDAGFFNIGGNSLPAVSTVFLRAKVIEPFGTTMLISNSNVSDATFIRANRSLNKVEFGVYNGTQYNWFKAVDSSFWNSYHSYGFIATANETKLFIDGEVVTIYAGIIPRDNLTLGVNPNGTSLGGVLFDEVLIVPYGMSNDDMKNWANQNAPFVDPNETVTQWSKIDINENKISAVSTQSQNNENWRGQFTVQPTQINQTVSAVYPNGTGDISAIQQTQNQITSTVAKINGLNFVDYFDISATIDKYNKRIIPTNVSVINESTATDGKALQVTGCGWFSLNENIPFDPEITYQMKIRVKQTVDPTVENTNRIYAGFECVASDGVTLINTNGQNGFISAHYFVVNNDVLPTSKGWVEYTGYLKGYGTNYYNGTITTPANAYSGVKYFRPMFIINFDGGNGTCLIDSIIVRTDTNDVWSQTKQSADKITNLIGRTEDNENFIAGVNYSATEIKNTVAAIYPEGTTKASAITQTNNRITSEVSTINDKLARRGIQVPTNSLYFNFDQKLSSTGGKEPINTIVASIRSDQGVFGGALAIEQSTSNLQNDQNILNTVSGAILTKTLVTTGEWAGWYMIKATKANTDGNIAYFNTISINVNEYLSGSLDFYSPTGNIKPYLSGDYNVSELFSLNNSKYRKGMSWQNTQSSAKTMSVYFKYIKDPSQLIDSEIFYYKDVQLEKMPYCTSFVASSRPSGIYILSGEHFPAISSIFLKAKVLNKTGIVQLMGNANLSNGTYIRANLDLNRIEFGVFNSTLYTSFKTVDNSFWNSYHSYGCIYANNVSKFFIDGVWIESATINYGKSYRTKLSFGSEPDGTKIGGVLFDELLIIPYEVTNDEQILWASQNAPFYDITETVAQWSKIDQTVTGINALAVRTDGIEQWKSGFTITPDKINSTVLAVYPEGSSISSIEQLSTGIASTVSEINGKFNGRSINKPENSTLINFDSGFSSTDNISPLLQTNINLGKGKFGKAAIIESSTTNLCAIDDSHWIFNVSNYDSTMNVTTSTSGLATSAKFTFGNKIDSQLNGWHQAEYKGLPATFDTTKTYTLSLKVKFIYGTSCRAVIHKSDATNVVMDSLTINNNGTNDWVVFSKTFTPLVAGDTPKICIIANSGTVVEVAEPQIEQKAFPTSFVNGSRTTPDLRYPRSLFNTESGTIGFWFNPLSKNPDTYPALVCLGDYNVASEDWFAIYWGSGWSSANSITFTYRPMNTSPYPTSSIPHTFEPYTWYYVVARWDKTRNQINLKLYTPNEIKSNVNTFPSITPTFTNPSNNFIRLGRVWGTSTAYINGAIDDFFISTKWVDDKILDNIFQSNAPLYDPKETSAQWSKIDQQTQSITSTVAKIDGVSFADYFDTLPNNKYNFRVSPTNIAVVNETTATGGKALQVTGYGWFSLNENIPFDPNAVYIMKIRVKQTVDSTVPDNGKIYAGFECVASDGVTLINTSGQNNYTSAHYFVVNGYALTVENSSTWKEYAGFLSGYGTNYFNGTITTPANVKSGVKFIRPMFVVNYNSGGGTCLIDYVVLRADSGSSWTQIKQSIEDISFRAMVVDSNGNKKTGAQLEVSSVEGGKIILDARKVIATGSIEAPQIAANAIIGEKIAAEAITTDKLKIGSQIPLTTPSTPNGSAHIWHYDRSLNSSDGIKALSGNIVSISNNGKWNGAVMVEVGTTNIVSNPSFESGFTGWTYWGSPTTREIISNDKCSGSKALRLITNANNQGFYQDLTLTSGQTYVASVYVKCISGTPTIMINYNAVYSDVPANSAWIGDGKWHRISIKFTAGTTNRIYVGKSASGTTGEYLIDDVQVEQKSFATSFTFNTRNNGELKYPISSVNLSEGTICLWVNVRPSNEYTDVWHMPFSFRNTNNEGNQISLRRSSSGVWSYHIKPEDPSTFTSLTLPAISEGWHMFAVTWKKSITQACIYLDGTLLQTNNSALLPQSFANILGNAIFIGGWANSTSAYQINSYIDELLISPYQHTADEIKSWYLSNAPFYDSENAIGAGSVTLDTNGVTTISTNGDYSILDGGSLKFYKNGDPTPYFYSRRVKHGTALNGQLIPLGFNIYPRIITSVSSARTFTKGFATSSNLAGFIDYSNSNQLTQTWANIEGDPINGYNARIFIQTVLEQGKSTVFSSNIGAFTDSGYGATSVTTTLSPENTTKITVKLFGLYLGNTWFPYGGYVHGRLYYQKNGNATWIKFWDGAVKFDTFQDVSVALPVGSYKIKLECLNDMDKPAKIILINSQSYSYSIIPNDDVNIASYIAIEGGAEGDI